MTASPTDVRAWAREQGHDVPARGTLPGHLKELYADAHPPQVVPGEVTESLFGLDPAMGVTEADFPPDPDDYPDPDSAAKPKANPSRERKPRAVKPPPAQGGWRGRLFGDAKPKPKTAARTSRTSLSNFAEDAWADLAFLASPIPPLARILDIQAPYAGVVLDDQVKGTFADTLLQPIARYDGMFRSLNGLVGPPVYVGLICATGQRVPVLDDKGKQMVIDGQPVTDFDTRTKFLFQGLRYSLLQMAKVTEVNAAAITARREESEARKMAVEVMIATIFDQPMPQFVPAAAPSPPGGGDSAPSSNGYQYPSAPTMDNVGAP